MTAKSILDAILASRVKDMWTGGVLRLTLLALVVVEATLVGNQRPEMTLARVLKPFPTEWQMQVALVR